MPDITTDATESTETTQTTEVTEATKPTVEQTGTGAKPEQDDETLGEPGKRALDAERTARKAAEKAASEAQAKLQEIEDAKLSEIERAQKAAAEATAALADITRQNLVNSRALAKGLPADLTGFITGTDEADVDSQIDTLMARINAPRTPAPDPGQGARTTSSSTDAEYAQYAAALHLPTSRK